MDKVTVFTPTYNRADCLDNLYKSLCKQTNKNFTWLVVDDGSTDDTSELIEHYIAEGIISIDYIWQSNQGKHVAHNTAIDKCKTILFTCVDSDDTLTTDAIETVLMNHEQYKEENLLGYYYYKRNIGNKNDDHQLFPDNIDTVKLTDLYHIYNYHSETMIVFYTDKIQFYKSPVFENEKFVTERVLYNKLNHLGLMRLCRSELYLFEYRKDGYTNNWKAIIDNNPYGSAYDFLIEAYTGCGIIYKSKLYAQYLAMCKIHGIKKDTFDMEGKPWLTVKLIGRLFERHYLRLFRV